uniref:Uncharacterized protein LOC104243747 isoform X4 n=1 Tax=Nicotiana sylvestris TaxID=4096 RepID=A0A1U7Y2D0_NICSY|nr:PREDICTED: uncharacterized protein LOC104243747 isoform X4 [Nicotiana sylvestris]XP_009797299.1 PREDICTED: uncharacterized protein LOC104243747 isoform X5 [Nicotiana sylvestris]
MRLSDSSSSLNCCESAILLPQTFFDSSSSSKSRPFLEKNYLGPGLPVFICQIIMASQIEENLPVSSTNAISLDDESQSPSQPDEVELKKRRYSRAWDHFKPVKVKGVPYGACKYCDRRYKNSRNCGTKSMLDHMLKCPNRTRDAQNEGDTGGAYFDQDVSRKKICTCHYFTRVSTLYS